jgi:hypothetical protein
MPELSEAQRAEIQRRAQIDATAHKSGWPVSNPYPQVAQATLWKKTFDEALKEKNHE